MTAQLGFSTIREMVDGIDARRLLGQLREQRTDQFEKEIEVGQS
ncbi:hypothetical protein XBLMG947_0987 [Xanthomonas bromi]|uniref:Uncharacterized protein n=1 Tax=Xanthomonas bromi TaxID=56449 RepID=A0A1C3NIH2_9XANT|nr:hypothetical protein [Xanthomonas bromi]SBV50210.1 hypothetical protein XBLMG947_0987 [Xanthomonas bromi]